MNKRITKSSVLKLSGCLLMFIVSAVFYLFWYWQDGIIITPDAQSYIDMISARDPGYSFFLWVCRVFAGWDGYQRLAVILQCLLAAVAACALTIGLWKRFSLHWSTALCILVIQYGITLLNRFVAQRRYSYYNSIETEAVTYSIWVFFILSLLGVIYDRDKKSIVMSFVWSVVLMATRKQMAVAFCILFLCLVYIWWKDKKWKKAVLYAFLVVIFGVASTRLIDCSYNYAFRGVFAPHTGDASFVLGTEIYVANEEMVTRIQSEESRELFLEIMKQADAMEYNSRYAGKGWQNIQDHYSQSYDRIKFDIVGVVIREHQIAGGMPQELREDDFNRIVGGMMKDILIPCIPGMFKIFCCNLIHGFVTTVLKVHTVLNWVALLLYLCYISLCVWLASKTSRMENSVLPFAILVLVAIAVNVGLTSAVIYPQMRYMLYNTGLFYQAGLLMLIEVWNLKKSGAK